MNEFFNNQRNAFLTLVGAMFFIIIIWYFSFHKNIQFSYNKNKTQKASIIKNRNLYKKMEKRLPEIEGEWKLLNDSFKETLGKIPHKTNYDDAVNALYTLLMEQNFEISTFSPSKVPLEKKYIKIQDSQDTVVVEKYPIDIQFLGDFVEVGEFLDALKNLPYRITANNIQISNGISKLSQDIKLIAYMYLQSGQKSAFVDSRKQEKQEMRGVLKTSSTPTQIGVDIKNPFKNMTLGKANKKAKNSNLKTFWWTNNPGIYLNEDRTRGNGRGDYVSLNDTGKLQVY